MPFRSDTASITLCNALDALADGWPHLPPASREKLEPIIRQYSVPIFRDPAGVQISRAIAFLEALWAERDLIPQTAASALAAGQGTSHRLVLGIDRDSLAALEKSVLRMTDPRQYYSAAPLARRVSELITARQDRLNAGERTLWLRWDAAYRRDHNADQYLNQVERLLGHYPAVMELLEPGKSWTPVRAEEPESLLPPWATAAPEPRSVPGADFKRVANVYFPATVLLAQQMVPLLVHLAAQYQPGSATGEKASAVTLGEGELTIVLNAEGFTVASAMGGQAVGDTPTARVVTAVPDRDSEPVVFFLTPRSPGSKHLSVDIYQWGRNLATLRFTANVLDQATASQLTNVQISGAVPAAPMPEGAPPDLELRVTLSQDRRTLSYTLHSPGSRDYNFRAAGEKQLTGDPSRILQRYLERLSQLARQPAEGRTPETTAYMLGEMADMGANLFWDLFPNELQREYARIRERFAGCSLLITSDEPWIPWELVKPVAHDDAGKLLYNDPFLCETFMLSRWLAGRGAPGRLVLKKGLLVTSADNLQYVQQEADYFAQLHRQQWAATIAGPVTDLLGVKQALSNGDTQLFHFACHGNFDTENPNESRVKLADGSLVPSDIVGARQGGLRQAQPIVFINACHAGRVGFALTGLGGWAERFVNAGAGAFIGSLWEINDQLAAQFAAEFYNRLWGLAGQQPMALAEAFHGARQAIKSIDPANPTWLAYVLYGDPKGRASIGG